MTRDQELKEIVARVKREYPSSDELQNALDNRRGSWRIISQYIDDVRQQGIPPRCVISMIDEGKTAELRAQAQAHVELLNALLRFRKLTNVAAPFDSDLGED